MNQRTPSTDNFQPFHDFNRDDMEELEIALRDEIHELEYEIKALEQKLSGMELVDWREV